MGPAAGRSRPARRYSLALAQDRADDGPVACVPAQAIVPPFNNTAAAMEQSRIAATAVMAESARRGDRDIPVCRTSAVAPQVSEVEGVNEVPVDPDYEPGQADGSGA